MISSLQSLRHDYDQLQQHVSHLGEQIDSLNRLFAVASPRKTVRSIRLFLFVCFTIESIAIT
jgi:prefoldin subunit 5